MGQVRQTSACMFLVEDTLPIQEMIKDTLEMKGFEVVGVETLAQARAKMKERSFDVVLLDVMLPDGSGLDLLPDLKATHPDTPVIVGTAHASMDIAITALNRGAYGFLTKPYAMDALMHLVNEAVTRKSLEVENRKLVQDLKALTWDLQKANASLKTLDELKSAFVSNVSHEVKSPMTIVKSWLSVLREDTETPLPGQAKVTLDKVGKVVDRLLHLVRDLLDIEKIEAGKLELRQESFDMSALIEESLAIYEVAFREKKLNLKKELAPGVTLRGDKDRLTQAFINLLSNGIKYTPEGGTISVRLGAAPQEVKVEITDTGPGIAPENLDKIFDKFTRVTEEKVEGTGLGLSIAHDIVRLHKGTITVQSQVGKGSTFTVLLPKTQ